jgi:hypothetical protein
LGVSHKQLTEFREAKSGPTMTGRIFYFVIDFFSLKINVPFEKICNIPDLVALLIKKFYVTIYDGLRVM